MKVGYFDCFSGISGDMILGGLFDLGVDIEQELKRLPISNYRLSIHPVKKGEIIGKHIDVSSNRKLGTEEMIALIERGELDEDVKLKCKKIIQRLEDAEVKIHGRKKTHLHELSCIDTLIDVVGAVSGIKRLGLEKILASPLHLGKGMIDSSHGILPVPAPATLELIKGIPVYQTDVQSELVTPTGAAIITTIATDFCSLPRMKIENIGYGAGTRDLKIPNLLRIIVGDEILEYEEDEVALIETNIDDLNPQIYDLVFERLFSRGALDAYLVPILMKKQRPANMLSVITERKDLDKIIDIIFKETTTLGIRIKYIGRKRLPRKDTSINTKFGKIKVKITEWDGRKRAIPEYEDCKKRALEEGVPFQEVYNEVLKASFLR
ncbi:MAG: nickel pincer cofactor biosynthesis protein LarC [bacterium]|nr:nickel pincer cofactor biosynthesis protein LarC [bacterium]